MNYFRNCPICNNNECHWLSTTNEWAGYCPKCDIRFNEEGEVQKHNKFKTLTDGLSELFDKDE